MTPLTCPRCTDLIRPGQLTVTRDAVVQVGREQLPARVVLHVACPTRREIEHRQRMGRT